MKIEIVSRLFMGEQVKLTPHGKVYAIRTITTERGRREIELIDNAGRTKLVAWGKQVYHELYIKELTQ